MASTAIGGVAYIKVDGNQYSHSGKFNIVAASVQREAQADANGDVIFTEKPILAKVSGTLFDTKDLDIDKVSKTTDATITVELKNGKVFTLTDALYTGEPKLATESGEFDFEFTGKGVWQ